MWLAFLYMRVWKSGKFTLHFSSTLHLHLLICSSVNPFTVLILGTRIISTALYGEGDGTLMSYLWVAIVMMLTAINFVINGKKDGGASNMHDGNNSKEDAGGVELSSDVRPEGSSI